MTKIKNILVESTPFIDCRITDKIGGNTILWFKMYWSQNSGTYGYQVVACGNDYRKEDGYFETKTGGCGYSKEAQTLQNILSQLLGKRPYSCHYEMSHLFYKYCKGGNYYQMSIGQVKRAIKDCK